MIGIRLTYRQGQYERIADILSEGERGRVLGQTVGAVGELLHEKVREYPRQRYVSRRAAYGVTFFSARQRRWFFAALRSGELQIPYGRTGRLRDGWRIEERSTKEVGLVNEVAYAPYVMGAGTQSRHERAVGWQTVQDIIDGHRGHIGRVGLAAIRKVLGGG